MKTKQINKMKVQIFEEKELRERLGLDNRRINSILTYQEKFPELLQAKDGFCISARNLHSKLNVGAEYTTWMKRRIKKYNFEEGIDFTSFDKSVKGENTYLNTVEYHVTLNMAKELCMVENNEIGRDIRKYFITMEDILRNYEEWINSRSDEKDGWNQMEQHIEEWCKRKGFDYTIRSFYTREANMLNQALLDMKAADINFMLKNNDKMTRNHLLSSVNKALSQLQELNCSLLLVDMSFEQREEIIKLTCSNKYSKLKDEFLKVVANS